MPSVNEFRPMKISAQEEYGLRCLLQLARAETLGESLTLSQLARLEGISPPTPAN